MSNFLVRNEDGSVTTTRAALRQAVICKILDELPIDLNDAIHDRIAEIIQKAIGAEVDRTAKANIGAEAVNVMLKEIDELINSNRA